MLIKNKFILYGSFVCMGIKDNLPYVISSTKATKSINSLNES